MQNLGVRSLLVLAATVVALSFGATTARSADSELLNVSHQVADIQKKMDQLRSRGRWARDGKLDAQAACGFEAPSPVFGAWGDSASYALAPQGDLAESSQWTLDKDASVVSDHDPFTPGSNGLKLGAGAEAVTPVMCVSEEHPTIRFFAKNTGASSSTLSIEVLYQDLDGHIKHMKIARLRAGGDWTPTLTIPFYVNMLAAASADGITAVAFKLKAEGLKKDEGGWTISSLYVDPFVSR